mmetsp:Transcript_149318/g.479495  ORF Transcript_149318/g.479495 Transcript_149318/m.479495 type:complete len:215 (+) Transcript_149318:551-1195(+)
MRLAATAATGGAFATFCARLGCAARCPWDMQACTLQNPRPPSKLYGARHGKPSFPRASQKRIEGQVPSLSTCVSKLAHMPLPNFRAGAGFSSPKIEPKVQCARPAPSACAQCSIARPVSLSLTSCRFFTSRSVRIISACISPEWSSLGPTTGAQSTPMTTWSLAPGFNAPSRAKLRTCLPRIEVSHFSWRTQRSAMRSPDQRSVVASSVALCCS